MVGTATVKFKTNNLVIRRSFTFLLHNYPLFLGILIIVMYMYYVNIIFHIVHQN